MTAAKDIIVFILHKSASIFISDRCEPAPAAPGGPLG